MAINKNNFDALREEINEALSALGAKYNCDISAGNIAYDDVKVEVKVTFINKKEEMSGEQTYFNYLCRNYGFVPEDYGKKIVSKGKEYFLIGFNPKARKNFCLIKDKNERTYSCEPAFVRQYN